MRKQQILLVAFLLAMLSGCASMPGMPGYISEEKSSFDGSVQLSMEPAFVYRDNDGFSGSDLKLSLLWRSSMENDDIVLEAFVDGAHSFARGESLHFQYRRRKGEASSLSRSSQISIMSQVSIRRFMYLEVMFPQNGTWSAGNSSRVYWRRRK